MTMPRGTNMPRGKGKAWPAGKKWLPGFTKEELQKKLLEGIKKAKEEAQRQKAKQEEEIGRAHV